MKSIIGDRLNLAGKLLFATVIGGIFLSLYGCGGGSGGGSTGGTSNLPPVANAGTDQTVNEQSTVLLDGTGSTDDGGITQYAWTQMGTPQVSLQNADSSIATFTAPTTTTPLTLTFQLTVTDGSGLSSDDQVQITVNAVNTSPTAVAGSDQSVIGNPLVTLDGTASSDSNGNIAHYIWVQTGGTTVTLSDADTAQPTFTAPNVTGELTFQLTVEDNEGATDSDQVSIFVSEFFASDNFDDGNYNNWVLVNQSGASPAWSAGSYSLRQANYLANTSSFSESYHLGACATYTPGSSWSNYRFSVDITPISDGTSGDPEGNDVGVMFRYSNINNYYRFSMSARYGFSRLEKVENGSFSTLKVDARGYQDGVTYTVTVDVQGDNIMIFLDGDPLFAYTDTGTSHTQGTIGLYCQDEAAFDNVIVSDNSPEPAIALASPVAYSIATTGSDSTLDASAVVLNAPAGSSVVFTLDNGTTRTDSSAPFTATFTSVSQGEHIIDAVLRNSSGQAIATDTNYQIGVRGDYFISIGDSIVNGRGDQDPSNNISADESIIASQGFQAVLSDLLAATLGSGYPKIIFNEGIGGDDSDITLNDRIDSILERHPEANKALILLGTNDAIIGTAPATFQINMQSLITLLTTAGLQVWVAKIPPEFSSVYDLNGDIVTLNSRIDNLTGITAAGPNLYSTMNNASFFDADGIHPNDSGYTRMAQGWHDILTP